MNKKTKKVIRVSGKGGAYYKCVKCGLEYWGHPGSQDECQGCGSLYIEWMNYVEMFSETITGRK